MLLLILWAPPRLRFLSVSGGVRGPYLHTPRPVLALLAPPDEDLFLALRELTVYVYDALTACAFRLGRSGSESERVADRVLTFGC